MVPFQLRDLQDPLLEDLDQDLLLGLAWKLLLQVLLGGFEAPLDVKIDFLGLEDGVEVCLEVVAPVLDLVGVAGDFKGFGLGLETDY